MISEYSEMQSTQSKQSIFNNLNTIEDYQNQKAEFKKIKIKKKLIASKSIG